MQKSYGFRLSANEWKNDDSSTSSSSLPNSAPPSDGDQVADHRQATSTTIIATHARHDEEADRIDRERAQAVELLGDGHRAELGGVVGADAAREHQADEDRADLAQHGVAGAPAEQAVGAEALHEVPDWIT